MWWIIARYIPPPLNSDWNHSVDLKISGQLFICDVIKDQGLLSDQCSRLAIFFLTLSFKKQLDTKNSIPQILKRRRRTDNLQSSPKAPYVFDVSVQSGLAKYFDHFDHFLVVYCRNVQWSVVIQQFVLKTNSLPQTSCVSMLGKKAAW